MKYAVVHELAHLIEAPHNARFRRLMEAYLPHWRARRDHLNDLPVPYPEWTLWC
ncbi:MAG: M48 family metallopeptidase [Planctomycetota bacterium]